MRFPEEETQHGRAEELPRVTESAAVTAVEPLDENRRDEIEAVVRSIAEMHDADDPVEDHEVEWESLRDVLPTDRESLDTRLEYLRERYERAYPSLVHFSFRPERVDDREAEFDFVPGQYVAISWRDMTRPYSVASSPNHDELQTTIRRVEHDNLSDQMCAELDVGDEVTIRGPSGDFTLQVPSTRDMAFLATGTGVAPLRSMIKYTFEKGRDEVDGQQRDVWLFLGSSWQDDLPYHQEFRDLADEHGNFHYVPTLSREEYLGDWDGEDDYIQYAMAKYLDPDAVDSDLPDEVAEYVADEPVYDVERRIDPGNLEVYACGVSAMVQQLLDALDAMGVPAQSVEYEGYG